MKKIERNSVKYLIILITTAIGFMIGINKEKEQNK